MKKWDKAKSNVSARSDALARQVEEGERAIPLRDLLFLSDAEDVLFRPLFGDGGLLASGHHFTILLRASRKEMQRFRNSFWAEEDRGRTLPVRVRFSFAHELAHTFLYDTTTAPPKSLLAVSGSTDKDRLERVCNLGAGRLLLPEKSFGAAVKREPLTLSRIVEIVKRFNVSFSTFCLRLADVEDWGEGIVAVVRENQRDLVFESYVFEPFAASLFRRTPEKYDPFSVGGALSSFFKESVITDIRAGKEEVEWVPKDLGAKRIGGRISSLPLSGKNGAGRYVLRLSIDY